MVGFGGAARLLALGALLAALAGCSSMGGLAPAPTQGTILTSDSLAAALFAVDLPATVEPGERGPRVTYGAGLDVTLIRADAEQIMAALPPPAEGRSYAVYAFAEADRAAVRAAASQPGARVVVTPIPCLTSAANKGRDKVAVFAVLPQQPPVTLAPPETLAALESRAGLSLPVCAGHSG